MESQIQVPKIRMCSWCSFQKSAIMSNKAGRKGTILWCTMEVSKDSCWRRLSRRPGPHLRATWSKYGTIWSRNGTHLIPRLLKISLCGEIIVWHYTLWYSWIIIFIICECQSHCVSDSPFIVVNRDSLEHIHNVNVLLQFKYVD